jgi:hypothetical protein
VIGSKDTAIKAIGLREGWRGSRREEIEDLDGGRVDNDERFMRGRGEVTAKGVRDRARRVGLGELSRQRGKAQARISGWSSRR